MTQSGMATKTVRLTPQEAERLARLAERRQCSESALLRLFVSEGLRETWLDEAVLAYIKGKVHLAEAAALAGLDTDEFAEELRVRGILGPGYFDVPVEDLLQNVRRLATRHGNRKLADALATYEAGSGRHDQSPLKEHVWRRVLEVSEYIARTHSTVREAAQVFGVSHSTVHKDVTQRLPSLDRELAAQVKRVLDMNRAERHIRGGEASRVKYRRQPGGSRSQAG